MEDKIKQLIEKTIVKINIKNNQIDTQRAELKILVDTLEELTQIVEKKEV